MKLRGPAALSPKEGQSLAIGAEFRRGITKTPSNSFAPRTVKWHGEQLADGAIGVEMGARDTHDDPVSSGVESRSRHAPQGADVGGPHQAFRKSETSPT